MEVRCKYCNRYLFKQVGSVVIESLSCKCGALLNFKMINNNPDEDLRYKFKAQEKTSRKAKDENDKS